MALLIQAFSDEGSFEMIEVPESSVPVGAKFGVRVRGDSMEPIYQDHQLVWIQKCNTLRPGEVGLFIFDGCGYVKAYSERVPDGEELEAYTDSNGVLHKQAVLISYNKNYEPKVVKPDIEFKICGRVLS